MIWDKSKLCMLQRDNIILNYVQTGEYEAAAE